LAPPNGTFTMAHLYVMSVAMFMSPDKSFFITVAALSLAKTEEQLALVVAHELSHYLLDHQVKRIFVSWFWRYGVF